MKDLVALQMTRRQPSAPYDSSKPKSAAQANRQVSASQIRTGPGGGRGGLLRSSNILGPHASAGFLEGF